jgi:hypothetical protein
VGVGVSLPAIPAMHVGRGVGGITRLPQWRVILCSVSHFAAASPVPLHDPYCLHLLLLLACSMVLWCFGASLLQMSRPCC